MLWLVWHMWILLLLAFAGGVIAGWILRSKSDAAPAPAALSAPQKPAPDPAPSPKATAAPHVPAPTPEPDSAETPASGASKAAAVFTAPEPAVSSDDDEKGGAGEDLTAIKGLGPKAAEKLNAAGVTRLAQIAAWSEADIEKYDALISGRGRIARDDWVGQAKALAGD